MGFHRRRGYGLRVLLSIFDLVGCGLRSRSFDRQPATAACAPKLSGASLWLAELLLLYIYVFV